MNQPHIFSFENRMGVPFKARLIFAGMGHGQYMNNAWAVVHESDPVVSFYDERWQHTPYGQLVSTYKIRTLTERKDDDGILLDTGSPDWQISSQNVSDVLEALAPVAASWAEQSRAGLSVKLSNRGNPDQGQSPRTSLLHAPGDIMVSVRTLKEASAVCRHYIDTFGLGGGNWTGGRVINARGRTQAKISFNGRVWSPKDVMLEEVADAREYPKPDGQSYFVAELEQAEEGQRPQRERG